MKIAICDDDKTAREQITYLVRKQLKDAEKKKVLLFLSQDIKNIWRMHL